MIPATRDLVLVVDDDPDIVRFVQVNLEVEGFDVIGARNGVDALRIAVRNRPDLAVVDVMMPGVDGIELTRRLRSNPATSAMPIIMLTAKGQTVDKVIGLTAGADDYVLKPFDTMELVARIRSMLRRTKEIRESSPLTGLPGNNRILQEVQHRAAGGHEFAVGHIDIDRFKTVNDAYGFTRGDEFIAALANCLQDAADSVTGTPPFIGHIGGDDFVLVCTPEQVKPLTHHAINSFLSTADSISDPIDAQRGYLELVDRRGNVKRANLVTISIGVSLSTSRAFTDPREVLAAASEMKTVAKTQPGSYVAIDRRTADGYDDRPISPAGSGAIPLPPRGVAAEPWPDSVAGDWTEADEDDWVDLRDDVHELPGPSWTLRRAGEPTAGYAPVDHPMPPRYPPWADTPGHAEVRVEFDSVASVLDRTAESRAAEDHVNAARSAENRPVEGVDLVDDELPDEFADDDAVYEHDDLAGWSTVRANPPIVPAPRREERDVAPTRPGWPVR